jgi:hypothetical protein
MAVGFKLQQWVNHPKASIGLVTASVKLQARLAAGFSCLISHARRRIALEIDDRM